MLTVAVGPAPSDCRPLADLQMTQLGRRMVQLSSGQVPCGFASGQGAQRAGAGGDELCDPLRVGAGVVAKGPADGQRTKKP